jgi:hypothetical protein
VGTTPAQLAYLSHYGTSDRVSATSVAGHGSSTAHNVSVPLTPPESTRPPPSAHASAPTPVPVKEAVPWSISMMSQEPTSSATPTSVPASTATTTTGSSPSPSSAPAGAGLGGAVTSVRSQTTVEGSGREQEQAPDELPLVLLSSPRISPLSAPAPAPAPATATLSHVPAPAPSPVSAMNPKGPAPAPAPTAATAPAEVVATSKTAERPEKPGESKRDRPLFATPAPRSSSSAEAVPGAPPGSTTAPPVLVVTTDQAGRRLESSLPTVPVTLMDHLRHERPPKAGGGESAGAGEGPRVPLDVRFTFFDKATGQPCTGPAFAPRHAHRFMLALRSPKFRSELLTKRDLPVKDVFEFKTTLEPFVIDHLMDYLYTDAVPWDNHESISPAQVMSMMVAAHQLGIAHLGKLCALRLEKSLAVETVLECLVEAWGRGMTELSESCLRFLRSHKSEWPRIRTLAAGALSRLTPDQFLKILDVMATPDPLPPPPPPPPSLSIHVPVSSPTRTPAPPSILSMVNEKTEAGPTSKPRLPKRKDPEPTRATPKEEEEENEPSQRGAKKGKCHQQERKVGRKYYREADTEKTYYRVRRGTKWFRVYEAAPIGANVHPEVVSKSTSAVRKAESDTGPEGGGGADGERGSDTETEEKDRVICCPDCGSSNVTKAGKTTNGTQRYRCRNAGCLRQRFMLNKRRQKREEEPSPTTHEPEPTESEGKEEKDGPRRSGRVPRSRLRFRAAQKQAAENGGGLVVTEEDTARPIIKGADVMLHSIVVPGTGSGLASTRLPTTPIPGVTASVGSGSGSGSGGAGGEDPQAAEADHTHIAEAKGGDADASEEEKEETTEKIDSETGLPVGIDPSQAIAISRKRLHQLTPLKMQELFRERGIPLSEGMQKEEMRRILSRYVPYKRLPRS